MSSQPQWPPLSAEQPSLETDRLVLAPFSESHLTGAYVSWLNDPEVVRYSEQRHHTHTLAECRTYVERFKDSPDWLLAVTVKGDPLKHIGNLVVEFDLNNLTAEMTILIGEKTVWGKGYGTEAWSAVLEDLLTNRGIRKVSAGTMAANEGMLRIMDRSGMTEEARLRAHFLFEGQDMDIVRAAAFAPRG